MRSITPVDLVTEFHKAYSLPISVPLIPGDLQLRLRLITEEFEEVRKATADLIQGDEESKKRLLAELTKELCDLLYVVYGTAVTFNLPIMSAFNRVHDSNMSKLGDDGKPILRDDGKVLKGPNYWTPDIEGLFE